jgi:BASS family bile acid:Na+ symporter
MAITLNLPEPIAIGLLIVSCMPGGTTSNIFTYFSKGNLALSVLMTVTSTVFGVLLIPIVLLIYASALDLDDPAREHHRDPRDPAGARGHRHGPAQVQRQCRRRDGIHGLGTRAVLHRFHRDLMGAAQLAVPAGPPRPPPISPPSCWACSASPSVTRFARVLRLHPRNARTVALETGIQNGPLAIAIIALTFAGEEQQGIIAVGALYSLFIVITSTVITLIFRRANTAAEQKLPDSLL